MRRRTVLGGLGAMTGAMAITGRNGTMASAQEKPATIDDAHNYVVPLHEFGRLSWGAAGIMPNRPQHRFNQVSHRRELSTHRDRGVTTPNNDTLYSSAWLDLGHGGVLLTIPDVRDRYFSVALLDAFTDNFHMIGTRATGGRGGRFLVLGPGQAAPATDAAIGDATVIRAPGLDVWMLARTLVDGPDDLAAANAIQDRIKVEPLVTGAQTRRKPPLPDPAAMIAAANELIARTDPASPNRRRGARFAAFGVGAEAQSPSPLSGELAEAWRGAMARAPGRLRQLFDGRRSEIAGWTYPPSHIGNFGDDDALRAAVAIGGFGALDYHEAMYISARHDATGASLDGANAYRLRLPARVPVDGFWSLSIYGIEPDGRRFFVDNPINRYAIGDRTRGIVRGADGSLEILVQREAPRGALAANWLPAPSGPMWLAFRAYLPGAALRDGSWRVPPLERVG